jgi:hypothetical protein
MVWWGFDAEFGIGRNVRRWVANARGVVSESLVVCCVWVGWFQLCVVAVSGGGYFVS